MKAIKKEVAAFDSVEETPFVISLVGNSGAGKSTLIHFLLKELAPSEKMYFLFLPNFIHIFLTDFRLPKIARLKSTKPTSSNVFVYHCKVGEKKVVILDCEGLNPNQQAPETVRVQPSWFKFFSKNCDNFFFF